MLAHLGAMLAHLDVGGHVRPSWGYVGAMLPHLGPFWTMLRPSWGYVGPSGVYVGAMFAHLGVMLGLCCHVLASCWTMLWAMLPSGTPRGERGIREGTLPEKGRRYGAASQ